MKILIAGGAGFVGSHLCDRFLAEGCEIWCLDNLITGSRSNIAHHGKVRDFVFVEEDILAFDCLKLPHDFNAILHFASPASPVDYVKYSLETLRVNGEGTRRLLDLAEVCGARFLFASTSEVYGDPLVAVQNEEYWGNVNPIGMRSMYDEGKRYGEACVMVYRRTRGVDARLIRIFNTYGPRMRTDDGRVIPNFLSQALTGKSLTIYGDGRQTRSFCYVDDLVEGIVRMVHGRHQGPVNLGNPGEFTVLELIREIEKILGMRLKTEHMPPLPDDPRRRKPDISKAKSLLGWEPKISLAEGLKKTVPYFKEKLQGEQKAKAVEG